jgi:hypothetical protein
MKKATVRGACAALVLLAAVCGGTGVWGQAQSNEPVVVGRASMVSIDAFDKLLADLGIPRSRDLDIKRGMEESPFLGTGAVATDRPLGVTLVVGGAQKSFEFERNAMIDVPVVAGKATPALQTAAGGEPVGGSKDTFKVKGEDLTVRRTADYLHVKSDTDPFGLSVANDTMFAADYKDPTNLFVVVGDLAAMRKGAPDVYKDLAKQIVVLPRIMGVPTPDDPSPALSEMDKIDKLTLAMSQDAANFHLKGALMPSPVKAVMKETTRPGFPAGTMVQMHLAYPDVETASQLEKQLATLPPDTFGMGMPPEYHARVKDLVMKLVSLNTRSEAMSVGFTLKAGRPVLYVVDQFRGDVDGIKEIGDAVNASVSLAAEGGGVKVKLDSSTYTAGDKKVQRLALSPDTGAAGGAGNAGAAAGAGEKVVIDEIQTGRTLYVTLSLNADEKYVVDLANAAANGKSSALCFGSLDLGAMVGAVADVGDLPAPMRNQMQSLKTGWAGKNLTWTVQSTADSGLTTDVTLPRQVVRDIVKLLQANEAPAPATTEGVKEELP